jgi:hypothetical protein
MLATAVVMLGFWMAGHAIDTCHFGSSLTRDLPASVEKGQEREVLISVAFLLNNFLGTF